jgi:asparagine synthase (glutamine-hydrolysing)
MCGVYLRYCSQAKCNFNHLLIDKQQFNSIVHRGPDKQFLENISTKVTIGFARLSIRAIENGDQPYYFESKYSVLNGELYNENEIRNAIVLARPDLTSILPDGDMQLLGLWLFVGGENAINIVEGMFAGIIFDVKEKTVKLIRDRFGEKPLFYLIQDNHLLVSSEARFPEMYGGVSVRVLDLVRGYFDPNVTDTLQEVKPGNIVSIDLESLNQKIHEYWNWNTQATNRNSFLKRNEFAKVFEDAVEQTLIADVPLATLLSGGLDSTAVSAAAAKILSNKIRAFTFKMPETSYDESVIAHKISKYLKIDHEIVDIEAEHIASNLNLVINAMDTPIFDTSAIPYFFLSREVSKSHKVALSGDGGDELFRGYYLYNQLSLLNKLGYMPNFVMKSISKLITKINTGNSYIDLKFKAERFYSYIDSNFDLLTSALSPLAGTKLLKNASNYIDESFLHVKRNEKIDFQQIDMLYRQNIFPKLYLRKSDRMAMANGLEIRNPMLNSNIVNFALSFEKLNPHSLGKKFIYEYCQNFLPQKLLQKHKKGFSFPITALVKYLEYPHWQMPFLQKEERVISNIWDNAAKGNINCGITIWSLLIANNFYKREKFLA